MAVLKRTYRLLRGTFLAMIAGFALINLVAFYEMRSVKTTNRLLLEDMLSSVERVDQLARDVDQKRLLIYAHVFENDTQDMRRVEGKIAEVDADFAATAHAYEPIATLPGEHETWETLQAQVVAVHKPIERVMELSRRNQDAEARAALAKL